jgi:hypothetical protein
LLKSLSRETERKPRTLLFAMNVRKRGRNGFSLDDHLSKCLNSCGMPSKHSISALVKEAEEMLAKPNSFHAPQLVLDYFHRKDATDFSVMQNPDSISVELGLPKQMVRQICNRLFTDKVLERWTNRNGKRYFWLAINKNGSSLFAKPTSNTI